MKLLKMHAILLTVAILIMGCSATAVAQSNTLLVDHTSFTLMAQSGNDAVPQSLVISPVSGSNIGFTVTTQVSADLPNWLVVTPASGTAPQSVLVAAKASSLPAGTYGGTIKITPATGDQVQIPVTLIVSGTSQLVVAPTSLAFNVQIGGQAATQTVNVTSNGSAINYTAVAATGTGGNWLQVNPTTGGTTPGALTVGVNSAGLGVGTYNGTVTINGQGSSSGAITIPVTLTVSGSPSLIVNPSGTLFFGYQVNVSTPSAQTVSVTSSGAPLSFTLTTAQDNGPAGWLVVSPFSGATPATLTVSINTVGLAPGGYSGSITISSPGAANPTTVLRIALLVTTMPQLTASSPNVVFAAQVGGIAPASQNVQVGSTGAALGFTVGVATSSGGNWLSVGPTTGTTPQNLTLSVDPTNLTAGTYTATVSLSSPQAGNSPLTFQVTLTVSNSVLINATPGTVLFNYQVGQAQPSTQTLQITSTGAPLNFTVTTTPGPCGANWLTVAPPSGTTPATANISVDTTGLPVGACTASVGFSSPGAANNPFNVSVILNISAQPLLNISPLALNFTAAANAGNPAFQTIALQSTDPNTQVTFTSTASTTKGGNWLFVAPNAGSTPNNLQVFANVSGLAVGTYTGAITITSPSLPAVVAIPVTLTITSNNALSANPGSLNFSQAQGGPVPPAQTVALATSVTASNFTATATTSNGGAWLIVNPASGTTPGALTVTVNGATLSQGLYNGAITVVAPGTNNSPLTIPVTLTIGPKQQLGTTPNSLAFTFQTGSTTPSAQPLNITSTGGPALVTVAVATTSGGNWLSVNPATGTTPFNTSVSANPANLPAGLYNGTVTITSPGLTNSPLVIPATLTVSAMPPPNIVSVTNAATGQPGSIAPGELFTIKGALLGPANAAAFTLNSKGGVDTILAGTRVLFDGIPAPVIYTSAVQINAIAPFEIAGRVTTHITVEYLGVANTGLDLKVSDTSPGIFTATATGSGQGSILNSDNSVNSAQNPAARGAVVVLYATGGGLTSPASLTGSVNDSVLKFTTAPVSVFVAGQPATVLYAGSAPGIVAGVIQVNIIVPLAITPSGTVPVVINTGGAISASTVTLAVK